MAFIVDLTRMERNLEVPETKKELKASLGMSWWHSFPERGCVCLSNPGAWDLMPMQRQKVVIKILCKTRTLEWLTFNYRYRIETRSSPAQRDHKETYIYLSELKVKQKSLLRIQNFKLISLADPELSYTMYIVWETEGWDVNIEN